MHSFLHMFTCTYIWVSGNFCSTLWFTTAPLQRKESDSGAMKSTWVVDITLFITPMRLGRLPPALQKLISNTLLCPLIYQGRLYSKFGVILSCIRYMENIMTACLVNMLAEYSQNQYLYFFSPLNKLCNQKIDWRVPRYDPLEQHSK